MAKKDKKYYWLKLPNKYFNQLEQKKMQRQEQGKEMQVIYLRMMLLSIDKEGMIFYQGVYDTLEEELAEEFNEPVELIQKTIAYLKANHMIQINDELNCFIPESLIHIGSECDSAERMRRLRKKRKTSQCYADVTESDGSVTTCYTEIEKDKEKEKETETEKRINYQEIVNMYNDTCVSFPKVQTLSENRKKAIKARFNQYTIDDFKRLFEMAEQSDFLKGSNNRNWSANFDWLIKDSNMAKVLDGNYTNRAAGQAGVAPVQPEEKPIHYETQADYFPPDYEFVTHPDDPFQ